MDIEITKMTSKGQVVIPQSLRQNKSIKEGEKFLVYDMGDSIVLKRVKGLEKSKNINEFEEAFASMWKTAKSRIITKRDIEREIKAHRKENA